MSMARRLLAAAWALAAFATLAAPGVRAAPVAGSSPGPGSVREHGLWPSRPEAGALAEERLVVWAPQGALLSVSDGGPPGEWVERRGSWWVVARAAHGGGVLWTFSASLAAWAEGTRTGPPLVVSLGTGPGAAAAETRVDGIAFEAVSPLSGTPAARGPAPPEGRMPPPRGSHWRFALAIAIAWGVGTAVGWRSRARGAGAPQERGPAAAPQAPPPSSGDLLRAAYSLAHASPAEAAMRVAEAVRSHPVVLQAGVTRAHTSGEISERFPKAGLAEALALADAVKYGGFAPSPDQVLSEAGKVASILGAGSTADPGRALD